MVGLCLGVYIVAGDGCLLVAVFVDSGMQCFGGSNLFAWWFG